MSKIEKFDRPTIRKILEECGEALEAVAEKHGLKLERKHCTYSSEELPVAFKFITVQLDTNGNAMDSRAKDFIRYASLYGLSESDFLAEFSRRGKTYRICGFKPRARKYPVLAECVQDGKTYKFPVDTVKAALAQTKAA